MWHYVFFTIYLRRKPRTEYTGTNAILIIRIRKLTVWHLGLEQYAADKIAEKDWSFVPIQRAMTLNADKEVETDPVVNQMQSLTQQLDDLKKDVSALHSETAAEIETTISRTINERFETRFQSLETRFQSLEQRLDTILELLLQQRAPDRGSAPSKLTDTKEDCSQYIHSSRK